MDVSEKDCRSEAFQIIYNAVDTKKYQYKEAVRCQVRKQMQVSKENTRIIGHVGNFCYQKNQEFLIQIMEEIVKRYPDTQMWFLGTGQTEKKVRDLAEKEAGLEEQIRFLGQTENPEYYYQGMDVFVLPSRFEGLPLVGVEAQCMKLPCIFSDTITKEVQIQEQCTFISLRESPGKWAETILQSAQCERECVRMTETDELLYIGKSKETNENMDMPVVSIIVPVYNVEAYIERCIQSLLDQTEPAIEVILIDDGSTDRSGQLCDQYAETDANNSGTP